MSGRAFAVPNAEYHKRGLMPKVDRCVSNVERSSPLFSSRGTLSTDVGGYSRVALYQLTWYYSLLDLSWIKVLGICGVIYLLVNVLFATMYHYLSVLCGVESSFSLSLFFSVVTIPGNGGYTGENRHMLDPKSACFEHRTVLIMLESYASVIFSAAMASLGVAKIERGTALRHRILFSEFATVTSNELITGSPRDRCLCLRVANLHRRPLQDAIVHVYLVRERQIGGDVFSPLSACSSQSNEPNASCIGPIHIEELHYGVLEEKCDGDKRVLLWLPVTIVHPIADGISPLADILKDGEPGSHHGSWRGAQIVVTLTGTDVNSGSAVEARKAYDVCDLVLGHHFSQQELIKCTPQNVSVDLQTFNQLIRDDLGNLAKTSPKGYNTLA